MQKITGLTYLPNYITPEQHTQLLTQIDQATWDTTLKRRVQHYGYRYDYKARRVTADMQLGPLPTWLGRFAQQLTTDNHITAPPDQVIINEYLPGQGIAPHIDCEPCFGDKIFSLSLGSPTIMQFTHPAHSRQELLLEPRSLLIMTGSARYDWKHAIPARKSDHGTPRGRRVSLTLRKVIHR